MASSLASSLLASLKEPQSSGLSNVHFPLKLQHSIASQIAPTTTRESSHKSLLNSIPSTSTATSFISDNSPKLIKNTSMKRQQQQTLTFIPNSNNLLKSSLTSINGLNRTVKTGVPNVTYNRVPIYKQRSQNSIFPLRDSISSIVTKGPLKIAECTPTNSSNEKSKFLLSKKSKLPFCLLKKL